MLKATFACPDLTTFCRLDELGLEVTGQRIATDRAVLAHLTVARVAEGLGVAWNTANDAVLAEGKRVLIDDAARFDGVKLGVVSLAHVVDVSRLVARRSGN